MSRPLRIEFENAFYHVMNRGRERHKIFHGDAYYQSFLNCVAEAHTRFAAEVHAYCLMPNHYHMLICTPRANLSRVMRHINGVYTQRYNRLRKVDGQIFRGRYKAILIDSSRYLLQVSRYIHRNPVDMKYPLVKEAGRYRWSSYPAYTGKIESPDWLFRKAVYAELGCRNTIDSYQAYVDQGNDEETWQFYTSKNSPAIWGDKSFRKTTSQRARCLDDEVDKKGLKRPVDMLNIIHRVAEYYQVSEADIQHARRGRGGRNIPRAMAMKLCQDLGGARLVEIRDLFNISHYSTVSQTISRLNKLMAKGIYLYDYNMLCQDLTP